MAYIGVARPIMAKYEEKSTGIRYSQGFRFGKAIRIEITPRYEDVSDYQDINETDEQKAFSYANVELNTSDIPKEAETPVFGHKVDGDKVVSSENDVSGYVGLGIRTRERISGTLKYIALWIHKVKFEEYGQEHETTGSTGDYKTPTIKGKAFPDDNGEWRTKRFFETVEAADLWLNSMAGIE